MSSRSQNIRPDENPNVPQDRHTAERDRILPFAGQCRSASRDSKAAGQRLNAKAGMLIVRGQISAKIWQFKPKFRDAGSKLTQIANAARLSGRTLARRPWPAPGAQAKYLKY